MEVLLLSFCLLSLFITAFLVMVGLHRQSPPELPEFDEEMPEHDEKPYRENRESLPENQPRDFLRHRVEDVLKQQLRELGFLSEEHQFDFLQAVLEKESVSISQLTPSELRIVFSSILELREERGELTQIARSA